MIREYIYFVDDNPNDTSGMTEEEWKMNKTEAIDLLKERGFMRCDFENCFGECDNCYEALNMAIKALEQENRMTRHEAIETLTASDYFWLRPSENEAEALNMAIAALEQEQKRGKWVDRASELDAGLGRHNFVCSECAHTAWYFVGGSEDWWDTRKPNYCPNCGADMRGDEE